MKIVQRSCKHCFKNELTLVPSDLNLYDFTFLNSKPLNFFMQQFLSASGLEGVDTYEAESSADEKF